MSHGAVRVIVAAVLAVCGWTSRIQADEVVTNPYPGITHIRRTDAMTSPTRQVKMNIVLVDLTAPEVRFKMTPFTAGLPTPVPPTPLPGVPWPAVSPLFEVVRQSTLQYLNDAHAQLAINSHFFAPFPVVNTPEAQAQAAYAYVIGLAASRGNVYSAFEKPVQIYAIVEDSPGINIDRDNNASVVHRDPADPERKSVIEDVTLWNAFAGSGQIITDGVKTIPCYVDAANPTCPLIGPGNNNYSNNNSWYNLVNARTAVGLTQDNRTLVLFTVDVRPTATPPNPPNPPNPDRSQGMRVGEVADVLLGYGVYNALNLDGGGSTTMAMQDPVDHVRRVINTPSDNPPRAEATNLAVYSDGLDPVTTAVASPAANASGWNNANVTVSLAATDLRSGISENPVGWVDQLQYSLAGAQMSDPQVVPGSTASVAVTTQGITNLSYFATDAAGNEEAAETLTVRLDGAPPKISGMPAAGCTLGRPDDDLRRVATVRSSDALSGVSPGTFRVTATSNERPDRHERDIVIRRTRSGAFKVYLRAEKSRRSEGRIYTITATATDRADNVTTVTSTCVVSGRSGHGHGDGHGHDDGHGHGHGDDDDDDDDRDHGDHDDDRGHGHDGQGKH